MCLACLWNAFGNPRSVPPIRCCSSLFKTQHVRCFFAQSTATVGATHHRHHSSSMSTILFTITAAPPIISLVNHYNFTIRRCGFNDLHSRNHIEEQKIDGEGFIGKRDTLKEQG